MPLLFSYGTLRDPAVQIANFGRELAADSVATMTLVDDVYRAAGLPVRE